MTQYRSRARSGVVAVLCATALVIPLTVVNAGAAPAEPAQPAEASATTEAPAPTQDDLLLNELQFLGSHNSYHLPPFKGLFDFAKTIAPDGLNADELLYEHAPLPQQFSGEGVRQIELDAFADPKGGRYAAPAANILSGLAPYNETYEVWNPPELDQPGTKVLHIPDFDMRTTCVLLTQCLTQVREWSHAHPGHFPVAVLMELKDGAIDGDFPVDLVEPLPYTAERLDELDAEIRTIFDEDEIFTPDDLRGNADTLDEVVTGPGWPTMSTLRGQTMFLLDNGGAIAERYKDGHPALEGRVMFTSGTPGEPDAAFIKLNDPIGGASTITEAAEAGYVVRTRADTPIDQAQSGDTTMQDAAFASGAQWVSTDYPVPGLTKLLGTYGLPFADYSSPLPPNDQTPADRGAAPVAELKASAEPSLRVARCNPVTAPDYCYDLALTEPEPPTPSPGPTPTTEPPSSPSGPDGTGPGSDNTGPGNDDSTPGPNGKVPALPPLAPTFTG